MSGIYAPIGRIQREQGGLLIEATIPGGASRQGVLLGPLRRAIGASLAEMGREGVVGRLLSAAEKAGAVTLHVLVTGARAAALAAERVYKGLEIEISVLGDEVAEVTLVDRPLGKSSGAAPQKIAVLYKRSVVQMDTMTKGGLDAASRQVDRAQLALNRARAELAAAKVSDAEVDAAFARMSESERGALMIKAARLKPIRGDRAFLEWYLQRAGMGGRG